MKKQLSFLLLLLAFMPTVFSAVTGPGYNVPGDELQQETAEERRRRKKREKKKRQREKKKAGNTVPQERPAVDKPTKRQKKLFNAVADHFLSKSLSEEKKELTRSFLKVKKSESVQHVSTAIRLLALLLYTQARLIESVRKMFQGLERNFEYRAIKAGYGMRFTQDHSLQVYDYNFPLSERGLLAALALQDLVRCHPAKDLSPGDRNAIASLLESDDESCCKFGEILQAKFEHWPIIKRREERERRLDPPLLLPFSASQVTALISKLGEFDSYDQSMIVPFAQCLSALSSLWALKMVNNPSEVKNFDLLCIDNVYAHKNEDHRAEVWRKNDISWIHYGAVVDWYRQNEEVIASFYEKCMRYLDNWQAPRGATPYRTDGQAVRDDAMLVPMTKLLGSQTPDKLPLELPRISQENENQPVGWMFEQERSEIREKRLVAEQERVRCIQEERERIKHIAGLKERAEGEEAASLIIQQVLRKYWCRKKLYSRDKNTRSFYDSTGELFHWIVSPDEKSDKSYMRFVTDKGSTMLVVPAGDIYSDLGRDCHAFVKLHRLYAQTIVDSNGYRQIANVRDWPEVQERIVDQNYTIDDRVVRWLSGSLDDLQGVRTEYDAFIDDIFRKEDLDEDEKQRRLVLHHRLFEIFKDNLVEYGVCSRQGDKMVVSMLCDVRYPDRRSNTGLLQAVFDSNWVLYHWCFTKKPRQEFLQNYIRNLPDAFSVPPELGLQHLA